MSHVSSPDWVNSPSCHSSTLPLSFLFLQLAERPQRVLHHHCLVSPLEKAIHPDPSWAQTVGGMEVESGLRCSLSTLIVPALPGCAAVLGSVGESMLVAQSRATLATEPACDGKAKSDIREEERILFLKSCLSLSSTAPSVLRLLPQKLGHRPKTQGDAALWTWVLYPIPHIARLRSRVWRAWGGRWTGFPNRCW